MPKSSKIKELSPDEIARRAEIARKALHTAKWARTMTKWLITHSGKGGVKWRLVEFGGKRGHESKGIVDMIAIRKDHRAIEETHVGDLFEIVLVQVKGGSSPFPTELEVARLSAVKAHHRASKVVLAEWKKGKAPRCFVLPDMDTPVPASAIFGPLAKGAKPPIEKSDA